MFYQLDRFCVDSAAHFHAHDDEAATGARTQLFVKVTFLSARQPQDLAIVSIRLWLCCSTTC